MIEEFEIQKIISDLSDLSVDPVGDKVGCEKTDIEEIELKLGCKLPSSYKFFLEKFDNLILPGKWVYGLDLKNRNACKVPNIIWLTLKQREDRGLSEHIVLFTSSNDGTYYGFDTSLEEDGESPVVAWYIDSESNDELDIVADDFIEYIQEEVLE